MLYFIATLSCFLLVLFLLVFYTLKNGISPMPTSQKMRRELLSALPSLEQKMIVDLGSGWGHLIFPLARKYQSCQIVGYENSPIPFWFSKLVNHLPNVTIKRSDFFARSLQDADLVLCYLFPKGMSQLKSKLEKELRPGAQVVSHSFAVQGWTPSKVVEVNDLYHSKIYFYTHHANE